ncbi:MAG: VOC family protein [Chloroflexi bacterium]|nr:VOC family protein [Chloroflexota bacterium]
MNKRPAFKITGFNHVVFVTDDMEKTVRFYRNVLGLTVKATVASSRKPSGLIGKQRAADAWNRLYFFELANGDTLAFVEFPGFDTTSESSFFINLWPGKGLKVQRPQKLDHVALNVENRDALVAVQQRLLEAGYAPSDLQELGGSPFVMSIYVYDPNGIPLEIAAWGGPSRNSSEWFVDPNPVPSLRD